MAEYIIAAASTADLPDAFYRKHNIPLIRYTYSIGMDTFEDDYTEESRAKAYQDMRGGTVYTTSMINEETYYRFFRGLMECGKNVIYLDMSKEMSSSFQASHRAASRIEAEFPE